jgi:eukaryotic-like serine/threonine-protein kinase
VALLREVGHSKAIGAVRIAGLGSTSLPALKAFLQGEQLYRRTAFDSAVMSYERAVALDSTFTLAFRGLRKALSWEGRAYGAERNAWSRRYGRQAAALNHGVAPRESLLIVAESIWSAMPDTAIDAPWRVDTMQRAMRFRLLTTLEEGTRRYPEDPEIWFTLGDARFHYGLALGISPQQALHALDRAIALDSAFIPSYIHTFHLTNWLDDAASLQRHAVAFIAHNPSDKRVEALRQLLLVLDPTQADLPETQRVLQRTSGYGLGLAWKYVQTLSDSTEAALRLARAWVASPVGRDTTRWYDSLYRRRSLASTLAYRGHLEEASRLVGGEDSGPFRSLFAELALAGSIPANTAGARFRRWLYRPPSVDGGGLLYALPWWSARRDTFSIREFVRRAESGAHNLTRPDADTTVLNRHLLSAALGRAYLELALGDTAEAARRLTAVPWGKCPSGCFLERLTRARLAIAQGQDREALMLLDPGFPVAFAWATRPVWALERARVADRLGEWEKAAEEYRFVAQVWRTSDPVLQPYVAEARAALNRVSSAPAP